jgi:hypothetical protein
MSTKPNKQNVQIPRTAAGAGGGQLLPEEAAQVRELIAGRHSKAALQLAKDLFKRYGSSESEALLVHAYKARIEDLLKLGMSVEAKALLGIVRERFPAAAQQLAEHDREISAIEGNLEGVVGPLRDPNLPAEERGRIETFIRQRIYDLPALATVSSLPPEHPLRRAASALATAFLAVTEGPVDDALLALPELSRRSPLAPWKALVRAIASYYRREDQECRKWLEVIATDSVPARLIPSFAAMLGTSTSARFSLAEQKLIAVAGDHSAALRSALAALEEAFDAKKRRRTLDAIRTAMAASDRCDAEMRDRLRQHIAVRAGMQHLQPTAVNAALRGSPRWDAYYFRLLARALEEQHFAESNAEAAIVWEDFRREAIKENWFAADGLEDGVLSLHVAKMLEKIPPDVLAEIREEEAYYRKPRKGGQEDVLPSPGRLYERACRADPSLEAFQMWLSWAAKAGPSQLADNVAESWRKARAKDIQPLLHLMESAEKRSAYKKSLKYVEEAEELNRLNPNVRRAKLRLLLSAAIRHLRQGKTHLAHAGIEQIESVPEVRPGEIAALAGALRWCCAALDLDPAGQLKQEAELKQSMGSVAVFLLVAALAKAGDIGAKGTPPMLRVSRTPAAELLTGAVKACALGQWAGLPILLPFSWNDALIAALKLPNCPLDAAQMLVLGDAALDSGLAELAFTVSALGLATGGANARFLFLRARALPLWAFLRQEGCFAAALELARRERDSELAGKILDWLSGDRPDGRRSRAYKPRAGNLQIASRPAPPELLSQILEEEQALKQFPAYEHYREPKYAAEFETAACDCPKCRARRGEPVEDGEEWDEDDEDESEDGFDDADDFDQAAPPSMRNLMKRLEKFLGKLPPEVALQVTDAVADGEDPLTALDRILGKTSPKPGSPVSAKAGKPAKAPVPEQGRLF